MKGMARWMRFRYWFCHVALRPRIKLHDWCWSGDETLPRRLYQRLPLWFSDPHCYPIDIFMWILDHGEPIDVHVVRPTDLTSYWVVPAPSTHASGTTTHFRWTGEGFEQYGPTS